MCYMKDRWIQALQLSTLSDADYCIEYSLTRLFRVAKNHKIFVACNNTCIARVAGIIWELTWQHCWIWLGSHTGVGVGWLSAKATGATWLSSKCLSSSRRLPKVCSRGNKRGTRGQAETHKTSWGLGSELAHSHLPHSIDQQVKSQTIHEVWRNRLHSTSWVAKMTSSHGKGNENKERQSKRPFRSFKTFPPNIYSLRDAFFKRT